MIETSSFLMVVEKNGNKKQTNEIQILERCILQNISIIFVCLSGYAFHDYLYFMVVTMGTVGFGDINTQERLGRMIVVVSIFILLTYIPN